MSEILNDYTRYVITENCQLQMADPKKSKNASKIKILTGREVKKEIGTDFELDRRFNLVSVNSTGDLEEYVRYYSFFVQQVESFLILSNASGAFVNQLDLGYMPVFIPPTYLYNKLAKPFREAIEKTGLKVYEKASIRVDGTGINSESRDMWCSRLELAELLGKHPCAVKVTEYLAMILPYINI